MLGGVVSCVGVRGLLGAVVAVLLAGVAALGGAIPIDGGWQYASWDGCGVVWTDGPYTFTAPGAVILEVRDDFLVGDQFRVFDNGSLLGETSTPGPGYSEGEWTLSAGAHSITIQVIVNPYCYGGFYLQVSTPPDTTPPTIHGCPGDIEVDAAPGAPDAQVWWTEPTATDDLSGVASFTSTHLPGERFPLGITLVTYVATDGVGNTSTCSFLIIVHETLDVVAPLATGQYLDRVEPDPYEPVIGELPVYAVYEVGELIGGCCMVINWMGIPLEASDITMTLYAVEIGEEFDVREALDAQLLSCDEELCFCFSFSTSDLAPGYYDIRLGLPFMDEEWIRVELIAPEA